MKQYKSIISYETPGKVGLLMFRNEIESLGDDDKQAVLSKALSRVSEAFELTHKEVAQTIGISEASASRLFRHQRTILPTSKEGELSLLLIKLYRDLDALLGGNQEQCQQWMRAYNKHLQGVPIELILQVEGLIKVVTYLDAMRGKM